MSFLRSLRQAPSLLRAIHSNHFPPTRIPQTSPHRHYAVFTSRHLRTSTISLSQRLPASRETLVINEKAKKRLDEILEKDNFLRIIVDSGGCSGFQYKFEVDKKLDDEDIELHLSDDTSRTLLVIDPTSLDILRGSTLDYEMELIRSAFRIIDNPQAEQGCSCGSSFNVKID